MNNVNTVRTRTSLASVVLAGAMLSTPAFAGGDTEVGGRIYASYGYNLTDTPYSGYVDGDPRPNGFEIDRVYLDFKKSIDDTYSVKATTDVGRGESGSLDLYLKYAYLQADLAEGIKVRVGSVGNAHVGFADKFWGGRWLAKNFADQVGAVSSADIGVHASGKHAKGMFSWGAAIVNGEGYKNPDMDYDKTFQARATVDPLNGDMKLPISVYVSKEFYNFEGVDGQTIVIGSVGFDQEYVTFFGEYLMDTPGDKGIDEAGQEYDVKGSGMSASVVGKVPDLFNVVLRYDQWDPNAEVEEDGHSMLRVGVTKKLAKKVHAGLMYETKSFELEDMQEEKALFVRMQAGF